jgi:hypothetical protein
VNYAGWDAGKIVLEGQVFEVSWGPQGGQELGGRRCRRRAVRQRGYGDFDTSAVLTK